MPGLKFGIFMAPFHSLAGQDPISAYQRDLEVIQLLDRLGYDEVWVGEHHSAGSASRSRSSEPHWRRTPMS